MEVRVVKDYVLYLRFEDGTSGEVDVSELVPFKGIFLKLEDLKYFAKVFVNLELGAIVWGNGADLSPSYLYSLVSKSAA
ncbi:MAG: hypothetical protein ChlgKO_08290 [Chlamydiales bacterium]